MKTFESIIKSGVFALVGVVALATACSDDDEIVKGPDVPLSQYSELTVHTPLAGEHTFSFSSVGNTTQQLLFSTPYDWEVELLTPNDTTDMSWITLFDRAGEGGDSISVWVGAAQNELYDARRATFLLKSGDKTEEFEIYQNQLNAVLITDPKAFQNLTAEAHTMPLAFDTNIDDIYLNIDPGASSWISLSESKGTRAMSRDTIWIDIKENEGFNVRSGMITVQSQSDPDAYEELIVYQYGMAKPVIKVANPEDFAAIPNTGAEIPLKLELENVASIEQLTLEIPTADQTWLAWSYTDDYTGIILYVDPNEGGSRSTTIPVCARADHSIRDLLEVNQEAAEGIIAYIENKDELRRNDLPKVDSTIVVKYALGDDAAPGTTVDFKIVDPATDEPIDWMTGNNVPSMNQVVVTCQANPEMTERTARIKIFPTGDEAHSDMIDLVQEPATTLWIQEGESLQDALNRAISKGVFSGMSAITDLELGGTLSDADWDLLIKMCKKDTPIDDNGTTGNLQRLNLKHITNTTMRDYMFEKCNNLKEFTFPGNLEAVPLRCLQECENLELIDVPSAVTIGAWAFRNCFRLREVWLPENLEYLYGYVFDNINGKAEDLVQPNMTDIFLRSKPVQCLQVYREPGADPKTSWATVFKDDAQKYCTLHVRPGYANYYRNPTPENCVSYYLDLSKYTADSPEWKDGTPIEDYKNEQALRHLFSWTNDATAVIEDCTLDREDYVKE